MVQPQNLTSPGTHLIGATREVADPDEPGASARRQDLELSARWPALRPFAVAGVASVVAGGIVAAVTRPTGFEAGPWVAAFLVLVGGVAQLVLGAGHAYLYERVPSRSSGLPAAVAWNVSAGATVAGTLASMPILTTAGGLGTVAAVLLLLRGRSGPRAAAGAWFQRAHLAVLTVVLVSVPVGVVLAWVRHG